jgi:chemotaxis response regulator CheB
MSEPRHRLLVVDDSNVIRRRIERANELPQIEFVGAACNGLRRSRCTRCSTLPW